MFPASGQALRAYPGNRRLGSVFRQISGEYILDIRHPWVQGLKEYDNEYRSVIFQSKECPELLINVASLIIGEGSVILQHFKERHQLRAVLALTPIMPRPNVK